MKYHLLAWLLLCINLSAHCQNTPNNCFCCSDAHNQFDFWMGDWNVYDTTGTKVGENHILSLQDHCILQENWKSANSTGSSYNYYNAQDSTWNQLWVDNRGNPLVLKGKFVDGKMVMRGETQQNAQNQSYYNQITWEKMADGSVVQTWEVLSTSGKLISLAFKGIYRKK